MRSKTAASWTSQNPIVQGGEIGYETDTGMAKIGDGTSHWVDLPYIVGPGGAAPEGGTGGVDLNTVLQVQALRL